MTRLTLGLVGLIAVTGIATSLVIRQSSQAKLREKTEASGQQAERIALLSAENERLSNLVTHAASSQVLPPDQLRELLRLRGQIGLLRQTAGEQAQLQATNERLRAGLATSEQQLAEARAAPNFWPKEQLTFAGYADPEAALKTTLWAMKNGDLKAFLNCWASGPVVSTAFENLRQKGEAEMAAEGKSLAENLAPSIGFHIVDKQVKSADEVILNLSCDGEGKTRKFLLQRVGSEWKLADMLRPGEDEP
jgi:hypothetical protein